MGKLEGKIAVITGASRGIGRDMALTFAAEGAKVVVSARTKSEGDFRIPGSIATTVAQIKDAGGDAIGVQCDVTDDEQIQNLVKASVDKWGRLDIWINNAAVLIPGKIEDMQAKHFDLLWKINIRPIFTAAKAVLPQMKSQGGGHILNLSSTGAIGPGAGPYETIGVGGTAYGAGKIHTERFTQGLASEVWPYRIGVNVVSPKRGVATEGQVWFRGADHPFVGAWETGQITADAALWMLTQDPQIYTGQIVYDEDLLTDIGVDIYKKYPLVTSKPMGQ